MPKLLKNLVPLLDALLPCLERRHSGVCGFCSLMCGYHTGRRRQNGVIPGPARRSFALVIAYNGDDNLSRPSTGNASE